MSDFHEEYHCEGLGRYEAFSVFTNCPSIFYKINVLVCEESETLFLMHVKVFMDWDIEITDTFSFKFSRKPAIIGKLKTLKRSLAIDKSRSDMKNFTFDNLDPRILPWVEGAMHRLNNELEKKSFRILASCQENG